MRGAALGGGGGSTKGNCQGNGTLAVRGSMPSSGRGLSRILYSWYVRCILDYVLEGLVYYIHAHNWFIGGQGNRRGVSVGAT